MIGSSIHTETDEEFVIYYPLYKSNKFSSEVWCARPAKMFNEDVEVDGKKVQRFKFVEEI